MIQKKALIVIAIIGSFQYVYAQKTLNKELPERLFEEGKEMFYNNNYIGCEHSLERYKEQTPKNSSIAEADYMLVCSQYMLGDSNATLLLQAYLETYPETHFRNQINYYIGSTFFNKKEWRKALFYFFKSDIDFLTPTEQEDYSFRTAYADLQEGKRDEAKNIFTLLSTRSKKYSLSSQYYLAYIDFENGDYDKALPVFNRLKSNSTYREQCLFYLTQGAFLQNDLSKTLSEGTNYLQTYPNSPNAVEVYRMLGNANSRTQNITDAIVDYEKYRLLTSTPISADMYLLGSDYYTVGAYLKAIEVLKLAAETSDKLGQAAYMLLGQAYLKVDDTANALLTFDAASRVNYDPTVSETALYNYAMLVNKTSLSVFDQSVSVFVRFLKTYRNSKYTDKINETLASSLLSTKNYQAGLNVINKLNSPGRQLLAAKQMMLYQLGTEAFIDGRYDDATKQFDASIDMGNYDSTTLKDAYFWRGETMYRQGKYRSAITDFKSALNDRKSTSANYGLSLYDLGYAYFQLKQYTEASTYFESYISQEKDQTKPIYADACNRLGDCRLEQRNYKGALNYYDRAIDNSSGNTDYSEYEKAFVLGLQKNYSGKITTLDVMMRKYPNSQYIDNALYEKARALTMLNRESDAIPVLTKLITNYPQSVVAPKADVQLAQLYYNQNNAEQAIKAYKNVIEKYPNTDESHVAITSLEGIYKDNNDINTYVAYVNSLGRGTIVTPTRQDSLNFIAAENIYMKGEKRKAKVAMTQYLQTYPNGLFTSDAHYYLGSIAVDENNNEAALNEFDQVIDANNPKYINDALVYASGIEFNNKNYTDAYNKYKQLNIVASTADNKNTAQLGMLRCASILNNNDAVVAAATNLIDNEKTSPEIINEARYCRGNAYFNLHQEEKAITDLEFAAKDTRFVSGAESHYLLAKIFFADKKYTKAEKQVMSFIKQGTPHQYWMARAIIILSDSYAAQGDQFQAKQYIESLKANYKGNEVDIQSMISERLTKLK